MKIVRVRRLVSLLALIAFGAVSVAGACPAPEISFSEDVGEPRFRLSEFPVTLEIEGTGWTCAGMNAGCSDGGESEGAYEVVVIDVRSADAEDAGTEVATVEPNDVGGSFQAEITLEDLRPGGYALVATATEEGFSHRLAFEVTR